MVTVNNKKAVNDLISTYNHIINELYNIAPTRLEPLKRSWDISLSKYTEILQEDTAPLSKVKNGLLQGLCEIPLILQEILSGKELKESFDAYTRIINQSQAQETLNNFLYKKTTSMLKKGKINNENEFWIAQLMIDLSAVNPDFLKSIDVEKLMILVDAFNSEP